RKLDPVLYIDVHVADGFDHGYDATYTFAGWGRHVQSETITRWLNGPFKQGVDGVLRAYGHSPHFYPSALDARDLKRGLRMSAEGPRYSTGYGDYTRMPTVLVEMHHLKPYRQRVLGAYVLMEGALRATAAHLETLRASIATDRAQRPTRLPVRWERDAEPFETIPFVGVAYERVESAATGEEEVRYLGRTERWTMPVTGQHPVEFVTLPAAWWVPASETQVIDLLELHGIASERIESARELELDTVRIDDIKPGPVYDTRARMAGTAVHELSRMTLPAGSIRVPYDQPRGLLAAALLEPEARDSLFSWGFFPEMLESSGAMDRFQSAAMADAMLAEDDALKRAFEARLDADPAFAADAQARLQWFIERSPYADRKLGMYPIRRELVEVGE
ncbi:MAG: carboxypeptidase, partial [Pseudomonadota bacterium]